LSVLIEPKLCSIWTQGIRFSNEKKLATDDTDVTDFCTATSSLNTIYVLILLVEDKFYFFFIQKKAVLVWDSLAID
jgi:hypothetical protein